MPRDITVTFSDGSSHTYAGAPDDVTPEQVTDRATKEFSKQVTHLDGGKSQVKSAPVDPYSHNYTEQELKTQKEQYRKDIGEFGSHALSSAIGTVKAVGEVIEHPIEAAKRVPGAIANIADKTVQSVAHPVETFNKAKEYVRNITPAQAGDIAGSAAVGGGVGKALGTVGELLGPAVKAAAETAPKAASTVSEIAQKAHAAGYVLKPSEVGGKVGKTVEGLSGSPKLEVQAAVKNQPVTNRLAAQDIGLPEGRKITRESLLKAKEPHNAVYDEVGALGQITTDQQYATDISSIGRRPGKSFSKARNSEVESLKTQYNEAGFDSKDAVLEVRKLRRDSNLNIGNRDPVKQELGYAQRKVADAIESQLFRHASSLGNGDLAERFKAARISLAKINNVQAALLGNTGNVSAGKLAKMLDKGVPLSDNLKLIADVSNEFGGVTRDATKLKNKVPVTVLEGVGGAGAAMALGPKGLLVLGARPAARSALLSKTYQKRLVGGASKAPQSSPKTGVPKAPTIGAIALQDQKRIEQKLRDLEQSR